MQVWSTPGSADKCLYPGAVNRPSRGISRSRRGVLRGVGLGSWRRAGVGAGWEFRSRDAQGGAGDRVIASARAVLVGETIAGLMRGDGAAADSAVDSSSMGNRVMAEKSMADPTASLRGAAYPPCRPAPGRTSPES